MARILVIGGNVHSLVLFRGDMIQQMVEDGNEVFAMAPATDLEGEAANRLTKLVAEKLQTLGVPYLPIPLNRTGVNPLKDLHSICWLSRKMNEIEPDVVLAYTMKPVIYGSIAAGLLVQPASRFAWTTLSMKQKSRLVSPSPLMKVFSRRIKLLNHFGMTAA